MRDVYLKKSIITSLFIALCVVIPLAFHAIPDGGKIFCPMHIPVLICGLMLGWLPGLICGLCGPLLSFLLTGMPVAANLLPMMIEGAVYGAVSGILAKAVRTPYIYCNLYISLVAAQIAGRVIGGLSRALIFSFGQYSLKIWATSYFVTTIPGLIAQLALIPSIVFALYKAKAIPKELLNLPSLKNEA